MNTPKYLARKGYARIYVDAAHNLKAVEAIIKELDEFEHTYLPDDLIAPFTEYPKLVYTGKFDGLCMNKLTAVCWSRGIYIWVCDNGTNDFMVNATNP